MSSATLKDLPAEIIDAIALQLQPVDCISLRLVCSALAVKSIYAFKNVCFGTRRHMLTEHSLSGLLELSRYKDFGLAIKTLMIGTERYEERYADPMLNNAFAALSPDQKDAHAAEVRKQRDGSLDSPILASALSNMPNCHSIEIVGNHIPASTAYQHYSPSEELVYHSWGARTLANKTGIFPPTVSGREKGVAGYASGVFQTVLDALTLAADTTASVTSLAMRVRYFQGVSINALQIPLPLSSSFTTTTTQLDPSRRALAPLRSLALTFDALATTPPFPTAATFDRAHESARSILAALPALRRLRLSAGYDIAHGYVYRVFTDTAWFARVTALSLNDCKCQRWDVPSAILAHCPALRKLTLANFSAPEGWFPSFLGQALRGVYDAAAIHWPDEDLFEP
ncbi:F-box domain cyclin-like protein [Macrophomina phaseolina MS6]|uniref:F-box domain cyclin-like protein n=1 Tax=Macrophomina phaseolina (strain MS6) TaxID=1126212 RepID=K2S5E6_MACPH|nr:F-box domain cyclin-like protein [Macrophomina phaseolina MS6]